MFQVKSISCMFASVLLGLLSIQNAMACGKIMGPIVIANPFFKAEPVPAGSAAVVPFADISNGVRASVRLPGYWLAATTGNNCNVALSLNTNLSVEKIRFEDEEGRTVEQFGEFQPNPVLARSFGRTYRAFTAVVQAPIIPEIPGTLVFEVTALRPAIQLPELADIVAKGVYSTSQADDSGERLINHAGYSNPVMTSLCLGEVDLNTGLRICPPHPDFSDSPQ